MRRVERALDDLRALAGGAGGIVGTGEGVELSAEGARALWSEHAPSEAQLAAVADAWVDLDYGVPLQRSVVRLALLRAAEHWCAAASLAASRSAVTSATRSTGCSMH
jgi:hypothetical protein